MVRDFNRVCQKETLLSILVRVGQLHLEERRNVYCWHLGSNYVLATTLFEMQHHCVLDRTMIIGQGSHAFWKTWNFIDYISSMEN